ADDIDNHRQSASKGDIMACNLDGYMLEVCDCNVLCPCWVGEDPDNGACQGTLAWHIERGTLDGIDVSGRTYAALTLLPGNALQGNWKLLAVIDESASVEQEVAILNAFAGKLGGPLADMSQLIGEVVGVERASITTDVVDGAGSLRIGAFASAEIEAYQGHFGKATNLQESPFSSFPGAPACISKSRSYVRTTEQYGIPDVNLEGRNAVQAIFHYEA
ncbi:MAG: DUF1326 domain-containing protein, partial [Vicinamibacterales bacterium]